MKKDSVKDLDAKIKNQSQLIRAYKGDVSEKVLDNMKADLKALKARRRQAQN